MRSQTLHSAARRIAVLRLLVLLAFLALAARAAHLSVVDARGSQRFTGQLNTTLRIAGERGLIVDRRGRELAVTVQAPSVYAIASELDASARSRLARALGVSRASLDQRLSGRGGFTYLARWVDARTAGAVVALGLSGVGLVLEPRRSYPARSLAGPILGFANIDGRGVRGIEQQEDAWLRGRDRRVDVQRDGAGSLLALTASSPDAMAGGDVALTLDATMQAAAESALGQAITKHRAKGGIVVSLSPETGAILALAEAPSFDPNGFRQLRYESTASRAFLDAVEPGSTLKIFLAAAVLDAELAIGNELIDCSGGEVEVLGKTIRDRRDFGMLDLGSIVRLSSNVGAVKLAQRLGLQAHHAALVRFGFGTRTGSGFPSESSGLLRPWRNWKPVDQATIAFGQGISVTPIQLAAATAALANGGEWLAPYLVDARRAAGGHWVPVPRGAPRRATTPETARSVLAMMETVVSSEGTGRLAALRGVRVAGKTGTAQKFDAETGHYSQSRYIAWFVGVAPADDPRIVVVVALDEPKRGHSGGGVAAPLFASVASAHLAHFGVASAPAPLPPAPRPPLPSPPRNPDSGPLLASVSEPTLPVSGRRTRTPAKAEPRPVARPLAKRPATANTTPAAATSKQRTRDRSMVPNFIGMSPSEAHRISASQGLLLATVGNGHAILQRPVPGTIVEGNERNVTVHFEDRR